MRASPEAGAEVISQALYSERVDIHQEHEEWAQISTQVDRYQGWIEKKAIYSRKDPYLADPQAKFACVKRCSAHLYATADTIYGPMLTLPFESRLELTANPEGSDRWLKVILPDSQGGFIQRGDVAINPALMGLDQICRFSHFFIGLPYTWGGRSSFGYDCSGFVQMLYRQMGVFLPRDSKDQCAWSGFQEAHLDSLFPGDLIFFGFGSDQIRHVGMSLGGLQFIHAAAVVENAPYIRISQLTDAAWNGTGYYPYRTARRLPPYNFLSNNY